MRTFLILFAVCVVTSGFSQTTTTKVYYKEYTTDRFRIKYPASWQLDASKTMGADLILLSPLEDAADKFRDNVNVIIQDLTGQNTDLARYKEITDNQLKNLATGVEIYESTLDNSGDSQSYRVSYAMTQGQFRLRIISKCFILKDKAYLVTFTSEFDKFENYSSISNDILKTFVVTD
jgi:PsbP